MHGTVRSAIRYITAAFALLVLSAIGGIPTASAQEYMSGARPLGLGGAYNSIGTGPAGMYHNPAGIATARMYAFSGTYEYTPTGNVLNATVVDSKTNPSLAASAGYSYMIGHDQAEDPKGHDFRLALAVPVLPNRVAVGLGGRYLVLQQNEAELARGFTLDAGVLFRITENVHVGLTGKNLIDVCRQPARCRGVTPRRFGGGFSYGRSTPFEISGDVSADLNSQPDRVNLLIEGGGEYLVAGAVPIRLGYRHRTLDDSNHVTAGVGWRTSRFGLDAGVDVNANEPSSVYVSTGFAIYFN